MTITYSDGRAVEAVLLARSENKLRVAIEGGDDVATFCEISGTWVSEDCEPVRIEFAWQRRRQALPTSAEECCCPQDLAAHLIHLLRYGSSDKEKEQEPPAASLQPSTNGHRNVRTFWQA